MESPKQVVEGKPTQTVELTAASAEKPLWWAEANPSGWDQIKEAFRQSWQEAKDGEQTPRHHAMGQADGEAIKGAEVEGPIQLQPAEPKATRRVSDWMHAEREGRYGFAARAQFPELADWSAELEDQLREGWKQVASGRRWRASREGVRRGWEFAQPKIH